MKKDTAFPSVRTTSELKKQVFEACNSLNVHFSVIMENLLRRWVSGEIQIDMELDADFIASAKEALASEEGQAAIEKLAKNYDPNRIYTDTIKV